MDQVFDAVEVGGITLRNRIVRSATWLGLAGPEGEVTEEMLLRYGELSRGGAGLIVSGYAFVSPEGRGLPRMLGASDDALLPGLTRLARAIRAGGAASALQIVHAGGQAESQWIGQRIPVAPSFLGHPQYPEIPRELQREEIARIIRAFGEAGRRARDAGFDAVQIHAAHGFLISQFLSPGTNLRTDRYGGDLRGRSRFLEEVVAAIQWAAGPGFPIFVKLNGADFTPGGLEGSESAEVAERLSQQGVSLIEVSGGTRGSGELGAVRRDVEPGREEGYFRNLAATIRRRVACPVAAVGGLRSLETMEEMLLFGEADLFSLSRPLICEPDLPNRWRAGNRAPARCTSCNGCLALGGSGRPVACVLPPGETPL